MNVMHLSACGIVAAGTAALITTGATSNAHAAAAASPDAADAVTSSVNDLRSDLLAAGPLHLTWDVTLAPAVAGGPDAVDGVFNFWVDGDRHRSSIDTEQPVTPTTHFEVAFNGQAYFLFSKRSGTLSIASEDARHNPMGLPNPLFLPLDFHSNDGDSCDGCRLRMVDLLDDNAWKTTLNALAQSAAATDGGAVAELFGPVVDEISTVTRVTFTDIDGELRPARIDKLADDGTPLGRIDFADYQPVAAASSDLHLPTTITLSAAFPQDAGNFTPVITYTLANAQTLDDADVFTIDPDHAKRTWDSDAGEFVN
jgi:hypothetical protein